MKTSYRILALCCHLLVSSSVSSQTKGQVEIRPRNTPGSSFVYTESHALLIGNSVYQDPGWENLPHIPDELTSLARVLKRHGFKIFRDTIHLDLDEDGLKGLVEEFIEAHGLENENNRLIIFYSGHGETLNGRDGYLVAVDSPTPLDDELGFRRTAVPIREFRGWALETRAKHVLFGFDSCFGGTVFTTRSLPRSRDLSHLTGKRSVDAISNGGAGEQVPARSVFVPYLVTALSGAGDLNGDGYITSSEIFVFVREKVAKATAATTKNTVRFGPLPNPELDKGEMVFVVPPVFEEADGDINVKIDSKLDGSAASIVVHRIGDMRNDNGIGMAFVYCPPGFPLPGNHNADDEHNAGSVKRGRRMGHGFWIGRFEATMSEWKAVMKSFPVGVTFSESKKRHPLTGVSYADVSEFVRRFNASERDAGRLGDNYEYRLPTELEWEYACQAGADSPFAFGDALSRWTASYNTGKSGVYGGSRPGPVQEVGGYRPNGWGIHDMHGHVEEIVFDRLEGDLSKSRIRKGGSAYHYEPSCRCGAQELMSPSDQSSYRGFRLVLTKKGTAIGIR